MDPLEYRLYYDDLLNQLHLVLDVNINPSDKDFDVLKEKIYILRNFLKDDFDEKD